MAALKIGVIAPMYNEELMLPHFLRHYGSFADRIVLIDNGSDDDSINIAKAHPKVDLRHLKTDGYDEDAILSALAAAKREMADFDWLYFPDIDEFVISDPPRAELEILSETKDDIFVTSGFCLVQRPGEPALDLAQPISRQRRWAYWSWHYCKPIVMRACAVSTFGPGKHALIPGAGVRVNWQSPFTLVHADAIDFSLFRYRKNRRALSQKNIEMGWSVGHFCRPMVEHLSMWQHGLTQALEPLPMADWGECYA